ncbi:MAG: methyl-accepting chemotaxis protein [Bdellovibrionota bacterium]
MSKWSLNAKIYFVLGIFVAASISISVLGLSKMSGINDSFNNMVDGPVKRLKLAQQIKGLFFIQLINEKNMILEETPEGMKTQIDRLERRHEEMKKLTDDAVSIASEKGKLVYRDYLAVYNEWYQTTMKIKELAIAGNNKDAFALSGTKGRELRLKAEELMDSLVAFNEEVMTKETDSAAEDYKTARNLVIAISITAILIGFGLAVYILRALGKSIAQVIANLTDSSNQVTSAAQQIAASSEELSQAATEQAASLEETSSSIEEMNSMVQKNAENAKRASEISTQSSHSAEKGKEVVGDMIKAIDEISVSNTTIMQQVDDSNQKISDIVKVIAEIGNKTKVINDIVFQTKLLSFNASVEAARAGEHGKGFAVVAEEVGNLAQMSGNAAKEISSMLEGSIQKVEGIVNETKQKVGSIIMEGKTKIEFGTRIAQQCGQVLDEIVENVSSVTQMANEISTACQEQSQGVQEITRAMTQLDQVTQTNAATSEEAASAAEELSSQSESLRSTVGVLVKNINGDNGQEVAVPTTTAVARTPVKKSEGRSGNVYPIQKSKTRAPQKFKKAAGGESSVPSEDDPRFEEV